MTGRGGALVTAGLALALVAFALVADTALRERADSRGAARRERARQEAALAAEAMRAALSDLEEEVIAGAAPPSVEVWSLPRAVKGTPPGGAPLLDASADELRRLLASDEVTPAGLPAAVVAALLLDTESARRAAAAALLEGRLPVDARDLPTVAGWLGVGDDPRTPELARRLAATPVSLPELPGFARRLTDGPLIVGWTRGPGPRRTRYAVPFAALAARAGVAVRLELAAPEASDAHAVRGVSGLAIRLRDPLLGSLRDQAPRAALWTITLALLGTVLLARRAVAREAAAVRREREFVAAVSHELRTPLAAMRLLGQTLAEGRGDPREYGKLVAAETDRLEALVERVLDAARAADAPRFAPSDAARIARDAVRLLEGRAAARGVELRLDGADAAVPVTWDADGVRRALLNLVENAVRHGPANATVRVGVRSDAASVALSVGDEGAGPRRRDRHRIFGRFERGGSDAPGTGLGLWIADGVARSHGGRVVLERGDGCTFALVLPRHVAAAAVPGRVARPEPAP